MVAAPSHQGLWAKVLVNNSPVREYATGEDDEFPHKTVRYIKATPGANFKVQIDVGRKYPYQGECLSVDAYVDGQLVRNIFINKKKFPKKGRPYSSSFEGFVSGDGNSLQKFIFSNLVVGQAQQFLFLFIFANEC